MKRKESGMENKSPIPDFFVFAILRNKKQHFLKNNPTPRGNQLHRAYFSFSHDGMSDQNR